MLSNTFLSVLYVLGTNYHIYKNYTHIFKTVINLKHNLVLKNPMFQRLSRLNVFVLEQYSTEMFVRGVFKK